MTSSDSLPLFQRERAHEIFQEVMPLLELHYKEIAHFKDIKLNPDFESYEKLERLGSLRTYTARDQQSRLVGYAVFFIRHNIHYKESLQAVQDIIFVHPEQRGFGRRFIEWCDAELAKEKVEAVYHHVKAAHNFGPMLERLGYQLVDLIYARRL
jgi:GNAT superfamily N-acetyltransferase